MSHPCGICDFGGALPRKDEYLWHSAFRARRAGLADLSRAVTVLVPATFALCALRAGLADFGRAVTVLV